MDEEQCYQYNQLKNNFIKKSYLKNKKVKQIAAAKAKWQIMLQKEEEKKKQIQLQDQQLVYSFVKDSLIARIFKILLFQQTQEILNEQMDDVKKMNKMVMYAKCLTVRDKQLQEKTQRMQNSRKEKDPMMEIQGLEIIMTNEELDQSKKSSIILNIHKQKQQINSLNT